MSYILVVLQVYFQLMFKWLGGRNRFELVR